MPGADRGFFHCPTQMGFTATNLPPNFNQEPSPRQQPQALPSAGVRKLQGLTLGEYFSPLKGSPDLASPDFSLPSAASTTSFSSGPPDPWLPWLGLLEGEEPFPPSGKRRHEKTHQSAGHLVVTWLPPSSTLGTPSGQ